MPQAPIPSAQDPNPGAVPLDEMAEEELISAEAGKQWRRESRRLILLVAGLCGALALTHFIPLQAWITDVQGWKQSVRSMGWPAHFGFAMAVAAAVMLGLPRLAFCGAAGLIFGFTEGNMLSLGGSLLGSYASFMLARRGARKAVLKRIEDRPWLQRLVQRCSWRRVFLVRQLMLPGLLLNALLGVSQTKARDFLTGTLLGYIPLNLAFCLVGSSVGKGSLAHSLMQLCCAVAIVNLGGALLLRGLRRRA